MTVNQQTSANNQPGAQSADLHVTDPELTALFDNFAFAEVLQGSALDERSRLMVQLAAIIAAQGHGDYLVMLGVALDAGVTPIEAKEIVYQAVPYVGIAKVVDFLHATNDILSARGIALPLPGQSTTTPETRFEKGINVQKRIIGDEVVSKLYASAPADLQHIQRLLSANCFGDYLTRSGIEIPMRELLTFSMLVALGGCEPQVKGHVAANLRVGNGRECLVDVLTQILPFIGYPRTLNGLRMVEEAAPFAASSSGEQQ